MSARAKIVVAGLAVAVLVALGACGGDGDSDSPSAGASGDAPFTVSGEPVATEKVLLPQSYKFEPAVASIKAGSTMMWENEDNFPHNVKVFGEKGQTKDLPIGATAEIEFPDAGTFYYQCTLHPDQMKGKVVVEA